MKKRLITGDRPTGRLHIGHYFGSLKKRVEMQNSGEYDPYILIADVQALTDNFNNPEKVHKNVREVAMDYLSVGIDPKKNYNIHSINDTRSGRAYSILFKPSYNS